MPRRSRSARSRTRASQQDELVLAMYTNSITAAGVTFSLNNQMFKAESQSGTDTKYTDFIEAALDKYGTEPFTITGEITFRVVDPEGTVESTFTGFDEDEEQ